MPGPLTNYLAGDHTRLDGLLRRALTAGGAVDRAAYTEFRASLPRHFSLEEKILLPVAQHWRGGDPLLILGVSTSAASSWPGRRPTRCWPNCRPPLRCRSPLILMVRRS
jgi:hypothetical protein